MKRVIVLSVLLSAIAAVIPILVLFYMLGVARKPAWMAAMSALASALVVSLAVYRMPLSMALMSTLYGAAFGIFPIAWIVFSSIMLYRLAVDTGKFEIIKDSVGGLTNDRRLQAMFIAFSFGAFIEGAAGFGAPVAVWTVPPRTRIASPCARRGSARVAVAVMAVARSRVARIISSGVEGSVGVRKRRKCSAARDSPSSTPCLTRSGERRQPATCSRTARATPTRS